MPLRHARVNPSGQFVCGEMVISKVPGTVRWMEGETISGEKSLGRLIAFDVAGPRRTSLHLGNFTWENGERDVRVLEVVTPNQDLRRLETGALRLGIMPFDSDHSWSELRQARIKRDGTNRWSNLFCATQQELDDGCGLETFHVLRAAGAVHLGTREKILRDKSKRRFYLCAVFRTTDSLVPVVAFVLTRVLPLLRGYPAKP